MSQDCVEAARWLRNAGRDDAAPPGAALYQFGVIFESGCGVGRDNARAAELYRLAMSTGGPVESRYRLGRMYAGGRGVAQNEGEAIKLLRWAADDRGGVGDAEDVAWWRKLAEGGNAAAQAVVGDIYRDGDGVGRDDTVAVEWYRKAADQIPWGWCRPAGARADVCGRTGRGPRR